MSSLETNFNRCVITLISRLKRSLQKITLARLKKSNENVSDDWFELTVRNQAYNNGTNHLEVFLQTNTWLSGNIFWGPRKRGPLDPTFGRSEEEQLQAFEFRVLPIIGQQWYTNLIVLYNDLQEFINQVPYQTPLTRLLNGFNLFVTMSITLGEEDITPLNTEQWEEREPTSEELLNVRSAQIKRVMRTRKYWAIKKFSGRRSRSAKNFVKGGKKLKENSPTNQPKDQMRIFLADLMTISLEAHSKNESFDWMCNLRSIYNEFLFDGVDSTNGICPECSSFTEYLSSKISHSNEWQKCNNGTKVSKEWCVAWRKIRMESDVGVSFETINKTKKYKFVDSRSESYMKAVKTLVDWLSSKIVVRKCEKSKRDLIKFAHKPYYRPAKTNSFVDRLLCQATMLGTTLITFKNDCHKIFG